MNRDEIFNIPAGKEMDERVAIDVMGWFPSDLGYRTNSGGVLVRTELWFPSTNIIDAWEVAEKVGKDFIHIHWYPLDQEEEFLRGWNVELDRVHGWIKGDTAPLAICRAALLMLIKE